MGLAASAGHTMNMIRRRRFLGIAAAAAALTPALAKAPEVRVDVRNMRLAVMPRDFTGLSYENVQLYNPDFFSAENTGLVRAFKALSSSGVLRLGGSLSNSSRWKSEAGTFETPSQTAVIEEGRSSKWEWKLCDPKVRDHRDGAITPAGLATLRDFCEATGWRVIYGLDCCAGGPERARDEGAHVAVALGDKLLAFQVANEADFFRKYRTSDQAPADFDLYASDYFAFSDAVRQAVPHAPFGGPDTAVNMDWVATYASRMGKDATLLSSHFYAMGPGTDPSQNAELLLSGKSRLKDLMTRAQAATAVAGVPFRLTETNSCYRGGRPGVSDAYASALWCADMMLQTAAAGLSGVCLHGGGDGIYTPIETTADGGTKLRPIYYGMQFAELFAGAELLACDIAVDENVTAYAGRKGQTRLLALINKGPKTVTIAQRWVKPVRVTHLSAPSLDAKAGVILKTTTANADRIQTLPAFGAVILAG